MTPPYRKFDERVQIIRAIVAAEPTPPLESFKLSASELTYYRQRASKRIEQLASEASAFKEYYALPAENPFNYVIVISSFVIVSSISFAVYLYFNARGAPAYPVYAALMSIAAIAAGWVIAGWITHRNTIKQNTNNLIFARFAQAPFGEAIHQFHFAFGSDIGRKVTEEELAKFRNSESREDRKVSSSVTYLLNYYEFISSGVLRGDLDQRIVRENLKSIICYYYDRCEPYIIASAKRNPSVFEYLIKLRAHYRRP